VHAGSGDEKRRMLEAALAALREKSLQ